LFRYALCFILVFYLFAPTSYNNKDLEPYKDNIINIIKEHCNENQYYHPKKQFLYFEKLIEDRVGECFITPLFYTIRIDPIFWKYASELERFQLVGHEVFHCALLINHSDKIDNFMYYSMNTLSKETIIHQMEEYMKYRCNK